MQDRAHPWRRSQRGQSVVEFALVAPILLGLLLGTIDTGMLLARKATVSYASRQGARLLEAYGATTGADTAVLQAITQTLKAGGADLSGLQSVTVFRANATDTAPGGQNPAQAGDSTVHDVYAYAPSSGVFTLCSTCDAYTTTQRLSGDNAGITIRYLYKGLTPLYSRGLAFSDVTNTQIDPNSGSYALPTAAAPPTLAPPPPCPTYTPLPTYTPAPTYTPVATGTLATATATRSPTATAPTGASPTPAGPC